MPNNGCVFAHALLGALATGLPAAAETPAALPSFELKGASPTADHSRLPEFFTDDPAYDAFANEYFMRHLSIDEGGVYWLRHPEPGLVDQLWPIEWDAWFLPWIDRGAMGLARQRGERRDFVLEGLARTPVDKYGYVFGAPLIPEPANVMGGHRPLFGWPWPKYNWNRETEFPTGWEFNDPSDGAREQWQASDIALEPGYVGGCLVGTVTGRRPELITPGLDVDVFQVPIIEIEVRYERLDGRDPAELMRGLRIYWTTDESPDFSEDRMVTPDFSVLPPEQFPEVYRPLSTSSYAIYPLYFPMHLHPEWGREGRRITGLKVAPTGPSGLGVQVALNFVRATYDVRLSTSNTILIRASAAFYLWSGNEEFLRVMLPRLRRATLFMNEHLRGKATGLLSFDWMVGKDGLGGTDVGHGMIGSYWDLLPAGHHDLESCTGYYAALVGMAELEDAARRRGIDVPSVSVLGPDNETPITYHETPDSLRKLAKRTRRVIERTFWNDETQRFCRNVDVTGRRHDYGSIHENVRALAEGIATRSQRRAILEWLDGRETPGDTSTGADIYHWRFAPRTSTRRNASYYFWPWVDGMAEDLPLHQFGNQMQDGGAVPMTSLFELMARTATGDQDQIDRAYARTREIEGWYADVKSAGGEGHDFYRTYYDGHPERGLQQGGGPPGGLGLDREFMSDASMGTVFVPYAFLGLRAGEDGALTISPALPTGVGRMGVRNVLYRGSHLTIEMGEDYLSLDGSHVPQADGLRVKLRLPAHARRPTIDGRRVAGRRDDQGRLVLETDLRPLRVEFGRSRRQAG